MASSATSATLAVCIHSQHLNEIIGREGTLGTLGLTLRSGGDPLKVEFKPDEILGENAPLSLVVKWNKFNPEVPLEVSLYKQVTAGQRPDPFCYGKSELRTLADRAFCEVILTPRESAAPTIQIEDRLLSVVTDESLAWVVNKEAQDVIRAYYEFNRKCTRLLGDAVKASKMTDAVAQQFLRELNGEIDGLIPGAVDKPDLGNDACNRASRFALCSPSKIGKISAVFNVATQRWVQFKEKVPESQNLLGSPTTKLTAALKTLMDKKEEQLRIDEEERKAAQPPAAGMFSRAMGGLRDLLSTASVEKSYVVVERGDAAEGADGKGKQSGE